MVKASSHGPTETTMRVCLKTERDTVLEKESIWMDPNTPESILKINLMEKVRKFLENTLGLYIWKDGERFEGQWQDGKFHGKGVKTLPDGTIFDGDWEEGRPVG